MKLRAVHIMMAVWMIVSVQAQDVRTCDNGTFKSLLRAVVSEGNRQYEYSCRHGIMQMADSIGTLLKARSESGNLAEADSLEYTADQYKLYGDYHYENGNYDNLSYSVSEQYFKEALSIYNDNSAFSRDKDKVPMIHRELAQLYYKLHRYEEALEHISIAVDSCAIRYDNEEFVDGTPEYAEYLDLQTQQALCHARVGNVQLALKRMDEILKTYPEEYSGYYETLRKKGKIWMLSDEENAMDEALPLYRSYLNWRKKDAFKKLAAMTSKEREAYWMRMRPFVADCYQLEDADPAFLYDVTLFSKGLLLQLNRFSGMGKASEKALQTLQYTYRQIQQKLPANSCAIEFVQYEKKGKQYMGAIFLNKKGTPQWVNVMSPDDFMNYQIDGRSNKRRMNSTAGISKNALYNDSVLFAKIWNGDLVKLIGDSKKVYFSPDGYLHQLAIEYMLPVSLAEKDFYRLTSTRRLMEENQVCSDAALIVGGIRYDMNVKTSGMTDNDSLAYSYMRSFQPTFGYLAGSMLESDSIHKVRSCLKDTLLVGAQATEGAFRTLGNKYPIINLSTHGFFGASQIPQGTDMHPCSSDESLSQSILALAGVNMNLKDDSFDSSTLDGILSARELSEMNMSNVDLAVISACQTGLGYVTADGVYGIQRGLKNAGVDVMIISLWDVDDEATSLLMSCFHKNLYQGMTAHQAFMNARACLMRMKQTDDRMKKSKSFNSATLSYRKKNVEKNYKQPQYCDAFIMIDVVE